MSRLTLTLIATAAAVVNARPAFVERIPNGSGVRNVAALGHVNPAGGGINNDFGLAFKSAGEEWNQVLCLQDSDGDGQTNGQELGDPCCEWTRDSNALVRWSNGVSHPGDASSTSDPSLWANIVCTNSNSSTVTSTSGSGSITGNVDAGSPTPPSADTPADSAPVSSGVTFTMASTVYSAVGAAMAIAAFFM